MTDHDEIATRLYAHLRRLARTGTEIDEDTDLVTALGLDSIQVVDLMLDVEDEFDIALPLNELSRVETAGEFVALIQRIVNET